MSTKILIVDDDPLMPRLYQRHLEKAGYELLSASDGQQALKLILSERPELIVMDVMMPGMDGLSALRELKRKQATKSIPVIIVTSHSEYRVCQQESQGSGAAVFLTKPFGPAKLVSEIQRLLSETATPGGGAVPQPTS